METWHLRGCSFPNSLLPCPFSNATLSQKQGRKSFPSGLVWRLVSASMNFQRCGKRFGWIWACHGVISRSVCVWDRGTAGPQAQWPEEKKKGGREVSMVYRPVWPSSVTNGAGSHRPTPWERGKGKKGGMVGRWKMGLKTEQHDLST